MKVLLFLCAGVVAVASAGCSSTKVDTTIPNTPNAAVAEGESRWITEFGDRRVGDTYISVNAADGKLTLSHITMKGEPGRQSTTTMSSSPVGWRAREGWFVYTEEDGRKVWVYDGGESLLLSIWKRNGSKNESSMHGLGSFPIPVPGAVLSRLNEPFRTKVEKSSQGRK